MLSYIDLKKGTQFLYEGKPYQVIESRQMGKAQDVFVVQTKIRNLLNGHLLRKTFHKNDFFEEAELERLKVQFVYANRDRYVFADATDPSKRFELTSEQAGEEAQYLTPHMLVEAVRFDGKFVSIILPVKIQIKVTEAPPGVKGDRAQGGTKTVTLESGAVLQVPLFIETGDVVEVNTESGEYVRRVS